MKQNIVKLQSNIYLTQQKCMYLYLPVRNLGIVSAVLAFDKLVWQVLERLCSSLKDSLFHELAG